MPTEPLKFILDREASIAQQRPVLNIACPLLRELVNHGTNVFRRCEATSKLDTLEVLPPLLFYYHMLEMVDGIEVLLSQACTNSAVPIVRTTFETFLQLKFLLASEHRRRALQWHVYNIHDQITGYERWDPTTNGGAQRRQRLLEEHPDLDASKYDEILKQNRTDADSLRLALTKSEFTEVEAEYQRMRNKNRPFDWFGMFDGPANRRELASSITIGGETQQSMYDTMYGDWSGVAHGTRLRHLYTSGDDDYLAYFALRQPQRLKNSAVWTANFLIDATQCVIARLRPGEDLARWYLREVQPRFRQLLDLKGDVR